MNLPVNKLLSILVELSEMDYIVGQLSQHPVAQLSPFERSLVHRCVTHAPLLVIFCKQMQFRITLQGFLANQKERGKNANKPLDVLARLAVFVAIDGPHVANVL